HLVTGGSGALAERGHRRVPAARPVAGPGRADGCAVGPVEHGTPAGEPDRVAALVEEAVMVPAEQHQVLQVRRAALRPVDDVVRVEMPGRGAPGEGAA